MSLSFSFLSFSSASFYFSEDNITSTIAEAGQFSSLVSDFLKISIRNPELEPSAVGNTEAGLSLNKLHDLVADTNLGESVVSFLSLYFVVYFRVSRFILIYFSCIF